MRLAQPVMLGGVALLNEGMELTQRHIDRLVSFGIETAAVDPSFWASCPPEADPDALTDSSAALGCYYAQRLVRLERLFRRHAGDPWMNKVRVSLETYFLGRMMLASRGGSAAASNR